MSSPRTNSHNSPEARIRQLESELEEMTMALAQAWDQLVPFLQATPTQGATTNDIVPIVKSIMAAVDAPMGAVYLAPHSGRAAEWFALPSNTLAINSLELYLAELLDKGKPVHISDVPLLNGKPTQWMFTSIIVESKVVGAIGVGVDHGHREFNAVDARLVQRMTERVASQFVAADLAQSRAREAHLEHELQIAGLIQRSIQPPREPQIAGVDVAADWQPAATVGGDAWGWVAQPCGRLACFMVDVAGKGLPAALAAVSLHTAVRLALRLDFNAAEVLNIANDEFYDAYTNASILATATVVTIDPVTGWIEHANAGHTPTLVCMGGEWQRWKASVPPLGVLPTLHMIAHRVQFAPGDRLLLYSDGLSEIETPNGLWTDMGLERAAHTTTTASAQSLISAVLTEAQALRDGKPLHDDQTLVGIIYRGTL